MRRLWAISGKMAKRRRKKRRDKNVVDIEKERRAREIDEELSKQYEEPVEISERTEASIRRRKEQRRRRRMAYIFVIVLLLAVTAWMARSIVELKAEQRDLEAKQQELEQRKEELKEEQKKMNSDEYVEEQARQQLKMIKPGEILYVLPDDGSQTNDSNIDILTEDDADGGAEDGSEQ